MSTQPIGGASGNVGASGNADTSGTDGTDPPSFSNATEKAIAEVQQRHNESVKAFNEADPDDPMSNLNVLQAQLKLTEAINFATNLMMTIHQQLMAIINKLGEAGR